MRSEIDSGPAPAAPDPFNLAAHVLARATATPDRIALAVLSLQGAERWSYARLAAAVRGTGSGLLAAGLCPGDRLLMRLDNTPDFPVVFLGAIAAGILPVPTSALLTAPEVARITGEIRPAAIAAAPGPALPPEPGCPVIGLDALRAMHGLPPCAFDVGSPDRPAYIVYTSGTSGQPRAVVHAHRAVWARQMMWDGWYGLRADDRLLHAGAFNWTFTLGTGLLDPWAAGATALIPAPGVTPEALPLLLRRHEATILAAAPGVIRQMLRATPFPALPALRHGLCAGEKLPETLRAAWTEKTGTAIHEAFGMSECSTFISGSPDRPAPAGSAGYAQPGRRVAVVDARGTPVPRGEAGTIAVHRSDPGLFLEYWQAEAETAARFAGEWFLTGDVGCMEPDGAITYLGRDDDMMNAGGVRVSPLEVEAVLNAHPAVAESAACELPVRKDASIIAAFYVTATPVEQAELSAHLAAHLARYKQPRMLIARDALPRNPNGKLARKLLRMEWMQHNAPA